MENTKATVTTREGDTQFAFNQGERQGNALSATLFSIALKLVIRNINTIVTIGNKGAQIEHADDLVIIIITKQRSESEKNVHRNSIRKKKVNADTVKIANESFEYLGMTIKNNVDEKQEIER